MNWKQLKYIEEIGDIGWQPSLKCMSFSSSIFMTWGNLTKLQKPANFGRCSDEHNQRCYLAQIQFHGLTWPTAGVRVHHCISLISFQLFHFQSAQQLISSSPSRRYAFKLRCARPKQALWQRKRIGTGTIWAWHKIEKIELQNWTLSKTAFARRPMSTRVKLKRLQRSKNGFKVFDSCRKCGVASAKIAAINYFRFDRAA